MKIWKGLLICSTAVCQFEQSLNIQCKFPLKLSHGNGKGPNDKLYGDQCAKHRTNADSFKNGKRKTKGPNVND